MRKIRVFHFITSLISGGAEENMIQLGALLQKENFDITISSGRPFELLREVKKYGLKFKPIYAMRRMPHPILDILAVIELYVHLKKKKYDIVHTHVLKAGFCGRLAAKLANVPIIIHTLHGLNRLYKMPILKHIYFWQEKAMGKLSDSVAILCEHNRKFLIEKNIVPKHKIVTIYTGISLSKYKKLDKKKQEILKRKYEISENDIIIGVVARLEKRKGHEYLIKIAPDILRRFENVRFIFCGDGPYKSYLENLAQDLGVLNKITFAGYVEDISEMLSLFYLFVLPSVSEGLPRVLIQSCLKGVPMVAFDIDGNPEIVKHGYNGYLVEERNESAMCNAIIKILENKNLRDAMADNALKTDCSKFSYSNQLKTTINVYMKHISKLKDLR